MKIYTKSISETTIKELIKKIKTGKYKNIGYEIIRKEIIKHLTNNPKMIGALDKANALKQLVKSVKKSLYKGIGVFAKEKENLSVKERDYDVYHALFSITGVPKKIVDLGSGMNPLYYKHLGCTPEYAAYEIDNKCVKKINEFFANEKINGKAYCKDIMQIKELPKADVYFLFKLLESIETSKSHKTSEELIKRIPAKWIIASFSTKTLSGKQMNVPRRRWIELMLDRLSYEYRIIETSNEMFYAIRAGITI
jgi:hypothetical protein